MQKLVVVLALIGIVGIFAFSWGQKIGEEKYSKQGVVANLKILPPSPKYTEGMTIITFADGTIKKMHGQPANLIQEGAENRIIFTPGSDSNILHSSVIVRF